MTSETGTPPDYIVVSREEAEKQIASRVEEGICLLQTMPDGANGQAAVKARYVDWYNGTDQILGKLFTGNEIRTSFAACGFVPGLYRSHDPERETEQRKRAIWQGVQRLDEILASLPKMQIQRLAEAVKANLLGGAEPDIFEATLPNLERILRRFNRMAHHLRHRHMDREGFKISDADDVLDLIHALLSVSFEEVRREEWTPSYLDARLHKGTSRHAATATALLLYPEKLLVEAKFAGKGWGEEEARSELSIDVEHFAHREVKTLVCFIYDPDGQFQDPNAVETGLSRKDMHPELRVVVGNG